MRMAARTIVEDHGPLIFDSPEPFTLECGETVPAVRVAYETWGKLNREGDNAVLVVHALTGSSHASSCAGGPPGWWDGLIGHGRALDPARHFIVCPNLLGSCYGSSGPAEGGAVREITTRDMVRAQRRLLDFLGVRRLALVIGGSLGGMVTWEWAVEYPQFVRAAAPIAGTPQGSPWMIALNEVARQAIFNDPGWRGGLYIGEGPERGLALAREIAMITYRTAPLFQERFGRSLAGAPRGVGAGRQRRFQVENYLEHQGRKLAERFDARSYVALTRAMDLHDVGRGRGGLEAALGRIASDILVVSIDSDVLYWPHEVRSPVMVLEGSGKSVTCEEILSPFGHDAFLVEYGQLNRIVGAFLERGRS